MSFGIWPTSTTCALVLIFLSLLSNLSYVACMVCVCCLALGYHLTSLLIFGTRSFLDLSSLVVTSERQTNAKSSAPKPRPCHSWPWDELLIPETVDDSLQEFLDLTLQTYIHSWYTSTVSDDETFLIEIRYHLRYILSGLYRRVQTADLTHLILDLVVPVATSHADMYAKIRTHFGHKTTADTLEQRVLDYLRPGSLHLAMYSRTGEIAYLRALAEMLMSRFGDEGRLAGWSRDQMETSGHKLKWNPNPRHLLRELIVFAILLPVLDIIAEPDTVNDVLIILFDPEPMKIYTEPPSNKVPFLHRMTKVCSNQNTDSLLQLTLTDIMREPSVLYLLTSYLKQTGAPLHKLQFLLAAHEIQTRLHATANGHKTLSKEDLAHVNWEAWELYKNYFHSGSPDYICFDDGVCEEFGEAVEGRDLERLETCLVSCYRTVYQQMQHDHIIPFCQSEIFYRNLTGERPEVGAVGQTDPKHRRSKRTRVLAPGVSETGFTLAKFRNRFLGVFGSSVEEGVFLTPDGKMKTAQFHVDWADDAVFHQTGDHDHPFALPDVEEDPHPEIDEDLIIAPGLSIDDSDSLEEEMRDLNSWSVSVPRIEPRRDPQGRAMYVYIVQVIRDDKSEDSQQHTWTVDRRYNEFYVLESKMIEFHGEQVVAPLLPPKKTFVRQSRAFVENLRPVFDGFLQRLVKNPILKGSELLHTFLTSPAELTQSFLRINPWSAMKKVPAKLSRERGQNMKHYLDQFLASAVNGNDCRIQKSSSRNLDLRSEGSGTSSLSFAFDKNLVKDKIYASPFRNNCGLATEEATDVISSGHRSMYNYVPVTTSTFDLLLYLGAKVFHVGRWLFVLLVSTRFVLRDTVDGALRVLLDRLLRLALHELRVVRLVRLLADVLFYEETKPSTEIERRARQDQARQMTRDFLSNDIPASAVRALGARRLLAGGDVLFDCLQHPRLNKQLTYVLLDLLVKEICPEIDES